MLYQGVLFRRFWLLALFRGIEAAGFSPVTSSKVHALVYLANALATTYGITPLDPILLKIEKGPLYPQFFWELERLVGMRLLSVHALEYATINDIDSAEYSLTKQGAELVENVFHSVPELRKVAQAQKSIALAYSRNPSSGLSQNLLKRDGNYGDTDIGEGEIVDFGEWTFVNSTKDAVSYLQSRIIEHYPHRTDPAIAVNYYAQYLSEASHA